MAANLSAWHLLRRRAEWHRRSRSRLDRRTDCGLRRRRFGESGEAEIRSPRAGLLAEDQARPEIRTPRRAADDGPTGDDRVPLRGRVTRTNARASGMEDGEASDTLWDGSMPRPNLRAGR